MNIVILTDDKNSWFVPYGVILKEILISLNHNVKYIYDKKDLIASDICFILSCTKIIEKKYLLKSSHNIVVHASDLPKGKGFSPFQWQILEGRNKIPITLFEADEKVDNGSYYLKDELHLTGNELYDELRKKLAFKIIEMCYTYVNKCNILKPLKQKGIENMYNRRGIVDDELDIHKSLAEQFNHLRIADNVNYPLYFRMNGKKYILKIYDESDTK